MDKDEVLLSDLLQDLKKRWLSILLVVLVATSAVVGYTYVNKPKWKISATLLIVNQDDLPQAGNLGAILGKESSSPLGILVGVVTSTRAVNFIAKENNIKPKQVREWLTVKDSPSANQLKFETTQADQKLGLGIVSSALKILEQLDRESSFSTSSAQLEKLNSLYAQQEAAVTDASRKLLAFQQKAKVYVIPSIKADSQSPTGSPSSQLGVQLINQLKDAEFQLASLQTQIADLKSRASATAAAGADLPTNLPNLEGWRKQLTEAQYELDLLRSKYSDSYPEVVKQRRAVELIKSQLTAEVNRQMRLVNSGLDPALVSLVSKKTVLEFQVGYLRGIVSQAPEEYKNARQLERELASAEANFQQLRLQLQQAKIKAAARILQWRVLDPPGVSDEPTNKDFGMRGALAAIASLLLSCFYFAARFLSSGRKR